MKSTKELLKEAFASVPTSFAYREVKYYLYHAIQKLETIEKRAANKEKQQSEEKIKEEKRRQQSWQPPIYQNVYQVQHTIDMIDSMIDEQKKIIEDARSKKTKKSEPNDDQENDDIQTIHG